MKEEQERLRNVLMDTIVLLCKSSLTYKQEISIEGVIGITVDSEVMLVHVNEKLTEEVEESDVCKRKADYEEEPEVFVPKKKKKKKVPCWNEEPLVIKQEEVDDDSIIICQNETDLCSKNSDSSRGNSHHLTVKPQVLNPDLIKTFPQDPFDTGIVPIGTYSDAGVKSDSLVGMILLTSFIFCFVEYSWLRWYAL